MIKKYQENWKVCNVVLMVMIVLISVPSIYNMKNVGLDPSWVYAINKFFAEGLIFGKDIVFTYGPLGFLIVCLNEGNNILIATFFWLLLLTVHVILLYQYLFKLKSGENGVLVILSVALYAATNSIGKEYYICYIALFSLMLVLNKYNKNIYIFVVILITSFYIKFSLFIMVFGLAIIYLLLGYFYDKELYKYCLLRIIAGIIVSPLIYFIISGFSWINFKNYVKGSIEVATGYNVAMSSDVNDVYAIWILIAVFLFLLCILLGIRSGIYNFITMALVGACLLMAYKHGFVRSDHMSGCMSVMMIFLSVILAFLEWDKLFNTIGKNKTLYITLISFVVCIAVIQNGVDSFNIVKKIKERVFNLPFYIESMLTQETEHLSPLPQSMIAEIGESSVTIYPYEISYCMSNNLNYVPLTVLQAYSIYTPYLDKISAEKFLDNNAPDYIILSMSTIDNRWPFIECPQTWEAIRNNYYVKLQEGDLFLLKHREDVNYVEYDLVKTSNYELNDIIELEGTDFLKISADLSIWGNIIKIIWKIPRIDMHVYYSDGTEATHRILLDMFSEGAELGTLASNKETLIDILNDTGHLGTVSKISFEGKGLKYYKDIINVEFYNSASKGITYPNEYIRTAYAKQISEESFSLYEIRKNSINFSIESVSGNENYKKLNGWAYVTNHEQNISQGEIYVEVDGAYYKCDKSQRGDVKEAFGLATDLVGYSVTYDNGNVGKVCIIDMENRIIYN